MAEHKHDRRWTVLLGGDIAYSERLKAQVGGTRVVAADSGMRHAAPLGVRPELWVGDFDSSDSALERTYRHVRRETHPAAKNHTDGELALQVALDGGATEIVLAGAFGGRADQSCAHLLIALGLAGQGVQAMLSDGRQEGVVVSGKAVQPGWLDGSVFSLLAFTDLQGVTITGARWPLQATDIAFGSTHGISNEVQGALSMSVKNGLCLALAQLET